MLRKDRAAWRTFYDRFDALASRCIARVVARFARTGAADDVGEIQAKLRLQLCSNDMAKLRSFDERRGRKLSSWVGLLAVNCAYDHLRAARRERARASLDECDDLRADAPAADDLLDWKQRAGIVRDLCADLSEKDRAFVALYFGEGLEVTEVAARLGISVKTVYSKKHKIQRRIEARLTPRRGAHRHGAASIDGLCAAA
jgi:RNA polymerase sigma-70 factor (ECF subfamily)